MKEKIRHFQKKFFVAAAFVLLFYPPVFAAAPSEIIPDDAVCLFVMKVKSDDAGMRWVLNSCKKWFLQEKIGPDVNNIVEDFNIIEFDEIAVGLMLNGEGKPVYLAAGDMNENNASVTFKYKNLNLKLKIKERDEVKGLQQGVVKALLDQWIDDSSKIDVDGIVFSQKRADKGDIAAYTFVNNRVIAGSNFDLVKEVREASYEGRPDSKKREALSKLLKNLDVADDGYLYIDNKTGYLANFARKKEALWQMPVLLSGDAIEALGIFFNIADNDSIDLRIVFQAKDPSGLDSIEVDARFMAEFFRRKLMQEKINCTYVIERKNGGVFVKMAIKNIEPYLKAVLKTETFPTIP